MRQIKVSDGYGREAPYRLSDGRLKARWIWQVVVTDEHGKPKRRSFSAPTKREAQARRDLYRAQVQDGTISLTTAESPAESTPQKTVAGFLAEWLEQREHEIEPSTYRCYDILVRLHIVPAIGKITFAKLTRADIRNMVAKMRLQNKSTRSIRGAFVALRCALNWAVVEGLLTSNPSAGSKCPNTMARRATP